LREDQQQAGQEHLQAAKQQATALIGTTQSRHDLDDAADQRHHDDGEVQGNGGDERREHRLRKHERSCQDSENAGDQVPAPQRPPIENRLNALDDALREPPGGHDLEHDLGSADGPHEQV